LLSDAPRQAIRAVPGTGTKVPLWILGSSLFGAQLAAHLGLPYAFASHFAPAQLMQAIAIYRAQFRPSAQLAKPYVMLGYQTYAAATQEEAQVLATSVQQAFVNLRTGHPSTLPPPLEGYLERIGPQERAILDQVLACSAVGTAALVHRRLCEFIDRTGADELILASQVYDHKARLRSYEIVAQVLSETAR
jgi:luciferase family oxidoreductase group 1